MNGYSFVTEGNPAQIPSIQPSGSDSLPLPQHSSLNPPVDQIITHSETSRRPPSNPIPQHRPQGSQRSTRTSRKTSIRTPWPSRRCFFPRCNPKRRPHRHTPAATRRSVSPSGGFPLSGEARLPTGDDALKENAFNSASPLSSIDSPRSIEAKPSRTASRAPSGSRTIVWSHNLSPTSEPCRPQEATRSAR
jgi:hypothetical protein